MLITPRPSANLQDLNNQANLNHQANIITFAFGIGSEVVVSELTTIASQPTFRHRHRFSDFNTVSAPDIASYLKFKTTKGMFTTLSSELQHYPLVCGIYTIQKIFSWVYMLVFRSPQINVPLDPQ